MSYTDWDIYDPSVSRSIFTDSEARSEYTRLRAAANQRLNRLEAAGFKDTAAFERVPEGGFPSAGKLDNTELRNALGDVGKFMSLKSTTVRGLTEAADKMVETMQAHGYSFINDSNKFQFRNFMRAAKRHYGDKTKFDSNRVVEAFERAIANPEIASPEKVQSDFEKWTKAESWEEEKLRNK